MTFLQSSVFNKQILEERRTTNLEEIFEVKLESKCWTTPLTVGYPSSPGTFPLMRMYIFREPFSLFLIKLPSSFFFNCFQTIYFGSGARITPILNGGLQMPGEKVSLFSNFWASHHLTWVMTHILQVQRRKPIESRHSKVCPGRLFWERVLELPLKSNLASGLWREGKDPDFSFLLYLQYITSLLKSYGLEKGIDIKTQTWVQ